MNEPKPPRSPFASESWEPRFVIEHWTQLALRAAIELWGSMQHIGGASLDSTVRHMAMRPEYLLVEHPNTRHVGHQDPWEALPEPIALRELAPWITAWLRTATYPKQPSFDGDEAPGFCVFWAHYNCEELVRSGYGSLVVMPKWFEIHK